MTRAKAQAAILWFIAAGIALAVLGGLLLAVGAQDEGDAVVLTVGYAFSGVASLVLLVGAIGKGVEIGVTAATPDDY